MAACLELHITLLYGYAILLLMVSGASSTTFTLVNGCSYTVWPGLLSNAGTHQLSTTGFALQPGESNALSVPFSRSGRLWGRTFCTQDPSGKFTCLTGDCGSSTLQCSGKGAALPVTLTEFTLNGANGLDFYDVRLVDGFNLPILITPQGGTRQGNCTFTGCVVDLNSGCPPELKVDNGEGRTAACKSACFAFGEPQLCCSPAYASPDTCKPSSYAEYFKHSCPRAHSYAYDDRTSTFTCSGADYVITFCPFPSSTSDSKSPKECIDASSAGHVMYSSAGAIFFSVAFVWLMFQPF